MNIPGIVYKGGIIRTVEADDSDDVISMYKEREYFDEIEVYNSFVKK